MSPTTAHRLLAQLTAELASSDLIDVLAGALARLARKVEGELAAETDPDAVSYSYEDVEAVCAHADNAIAALHDLRDSRARLIEGPGAPTADPPVAEGV